MMAWAPLSSIRETQSDWREGTMMTGVSLSLC